MHKAADICPREGKMEILVDRKPDELIVSN
jgi:hypothetical protein